jgi:hypothetical protein
VPRESVAHTTDGDLRLDRRLITSALSNVGPQTQAASPHLHVK